MFAQPPASVAWIVNGKDPGATGVPDNRPPELSVSPGGSDPLVTLKLTGGVAPLSVNCCEYGTPSVAGGTGEGDTEHGIGVGVGVNVGVEVNGMLVAVGVGVAVTVNAGVTVGVFVGVLVAIGVGVIVAVLVGVTVGVLVGVTVGVLVGVIVSVGVGVLVGVTVSVGVGVLVRVGVCAETTAGYSPASSANATKGLLARRRAVSTKYLSIFWVRICAARSKSPSVWQDRCRRQTNGSRSSRASAPGSDPDARPGAPGDTAEDADRRGGAEIQERGLAGP